MRLCHSSILIFTCLTCLGFYPNRASTTTSDLTSTELAQASSTVPAPAVLEPGSQGADVRQLQTQLKELGYYSSLVNGYYSPNTQIAVAKFQKEQRLRRVDGIADLATRRYLQAKLLADTQLAVSPIVSSTPTPQPTIKPKQTQPDFLWWSLLGLGILGSMGAIIFFIRWFRQFQRSQNSQTPELKALNPAKADSVTPPLPVDTTPEQQEDTAPVTSSPTETASIPTAVLPPEKTSRLPKLNVVDELMNDLHSNEPTKRRKAIWNLGQQGDSRAIQSLVDLMIDADSQERSLILAALAEISSRTLKPLNRALAISMQDESPQVRQNAIRDLTRVYDMMSQMSQMLSHALEDSDAEVQSTAKYALTQMNKMRGLPTQKSLPEGIHQEAEEQGNRGAEEDNSN